MKHEIPEELISAYLDGELTSDEQVLVEQALHENPQSRQLLEELQSLHDRLQSIPRSEPSRDYTQQILQRAERAILTGQTDTDDSLSAPPAATAQNTVMPTVQVANQPTGPRNWQHLIWASTVLAATLLLALLFRPRAEIVQQITDATGEPSHQATSADPNTNDGESGTLVNKTGPSADKGRQEQDLEKISSTRESKGGFADNDRVQHSSADRTADSPLPENEDLVPGLATASKESHRPNVPSDDDHSFVYYVAVSQDQFNKKAVFQTLLNHQVVFAYDPAVQNDFRNRSEQLRVADDEALDVVKAKSGKQEVAKATEKNSAPAANEEKALARSSGPEQFGQQKRQPSYRVLTIKGTPEKLGPLFQELANHNQLQPSQQNNVDAELQNRRINKRADLSSVNRETRQRLQSLSKRDKPAPTAIENADPAADKAAPPAPKVSRQPTRQRKEKPNAPAGEKQPKKDEADKVNRTKDSKAKDSAKTGQSRPDRSTSGLNQVLAEEEEAAEEGAARSTTIVRIVVVVIPQRGVGEAAGGQAGAAAKPSDAPAKKDKQPK